MKLVDSGLGFSALALPVFLIEMGGQLSLKLTTLCRHKYRLLDSVGFSHSEVRLVWRTLLRSWVGNQLLSRNLNMFTTSTCHRYGLFLCVTLLSQPGIRRYFPRGFSLSMHGSVAVYFEAAAVIVVAGVVGVRLLLNSSAEKNPLRLSPTRPLLDLASAPRQENWTRCSESRCVARSS